MLQKRIGTLTAPKLRIILISLIVLTIALCMIGFWFFHAQLVAYAKQVQADNAVASSSSNDIVNLQKLDKQLKEDAVAVTRAKNIVADSQYYEYQNQIISDINTYAKKSGISITAFTFSDSSTPAASAPAAGVAPVAAPTPTGLKSIQASITIKSPVEYKAIMKFAHSIEVNLTKMQLSGISMTGTPGSLTNEVGVSPITIEVYTR